MCTTYTLHYKCGHTQTSRRCPRSTFTRTTEQGGTASYTKGCGDRYFLKGELDDECIACKMQRGLAPGRGTGFDAWAGEVKRGSFVEGGGIGGGNVNVGDAVEGRSAASVGSGFEEDKAPGAETVDPTLLVNGTRDMSEDTKTDIQGDQAEQADFEARLQAAWEHEQKVRSSSIATDTSGQTYCSRVNGDSTIGEGVVSPHMVIRDGSEQADGAVSGGLPISILDGAMDVDPVEVVEEMIDKVMGQDDWSWGGMVEFGSKVV
ncbi:hypothetical protein K458DRAFT_456193 [Lentithecium fluviatile CBS 122367]|uniref:Uncharacterized protein n=1 Tax=Lentithecium fluviatile CBS 122367 TaxID=1168545 RepID=A0A6G1IW20_9PLEO|nr:hypothetical protein K458DRAFT_456193 [Lentithecium fluviatile CBS 122367]